MSANLVTYDAARSALAQATKIDDVKDIHDKASALAAYARQRKDSEMEKWVAKIKVRACTRIGELSRELETSKPDRGHGNGLPDGGKSKSTVLKAAGISTSTAHRCEQLANPEGAEALDLFIETAEKPITITQALHAVESATREAKAKLELQKNVVPLVSGLHLGDFRVLSDSIADESIELIFTDPPYDRDAIPLFGDLARIAARVLRPGGSLIAYCGQTQLPDVLRLMGEHLRYWWINACIHDAALNPMQMNKYGIKVTWKPMVWFVKGTRGDVQTFVLDSVTGGREKTAHKWQQAQSEAEYYIERLCSEGGVVWEPFSGGGTTIAACMATGRKYIAHEIDEHAAVASSKRVMT